MSEPIYKIIDPTPDDLYDCTITVCEVDGVEVWRAATPDSIDIATVLNIDVGVYEDERTTTDTTEIAYRVPTVDEAAGLFLTADQHREIATYAAVIEAVTVDDAAKACELPVQALVDEAIAWAVAAP